MLTADEQKYLDEAKRQRGQGGGGERAGGPRTSPAPEAANLVPLTELAGDYKGQEGGLYGGGKNEPPAMHAVLAAKAIAEIKPLAAGGEPQATARSCC